MQSISHITVQEANLVVPNKKGYHTALKRNGYLLPGLREPITTLRFLKHVRSKRYWCPNASEHVALKPCADTPARKELAAICYDVMVRFRSLGEPYDSGLRRTAKWIRKRPPHTDWLIVVLSTIDPDNAIFSRDYVHKKQVQSVAERAHQVDNSDDFFTGLPMVEGASGRRGVSFLSRQQLKDERLRKLRQRMYKI